jgi:hypothetical protein
VAERANLSPGARQIEQGEPCEERREPGRHRIAVRDDEQPDRERAPRALIP